MNKKKVMIISILILLLIIGVVTFSYAYWRLTYQATSVNKIVSSCFSMELTNEKNNITLEDAYPISDEKGKVLTPYSFTITNTCDLFASYTINLEMLEGTTLNSKYIKTMINSEAIANLSTLEATDPSIEGAIESRILFRGSLGSGDSTDYTFRLWMDYDTPNNEESMNKSFQGKITVTGEVSTYSPVENGFTNLADALLVNEYQTTSLEVAKNKINSKQEVDFTKTAPIIEWQEVDNKTTEDKTVWKAESSLIGSYGVVEEATKILFALSYRFDEETGYYYLTETNYYDPKTLDYSTNDYYFCNSSINASPNNTITYWDGASCSYLYKISSLSSVTEATLTLSEGDVVPVNTYVFKVYALTETELESDKSDKGLYETLDDYGTTYYYRGNVTNNYVVFGNFYWRVIRINGDGSTRLLYAGPSSTSTGQSLIIGTSKYNESRKNPTYVGYMYSNTLNTSYEDTIKNNNNSTIKTTLDNWYKINILDTGYSSYIADSGFCNDRSISSDSSGSGATDSEATLYSPRYRVLNYNPSFKCPNPENDLFTLTNNSVGNKTLTYPVGTITTDELIYAGTLFKKLNKMAYTYSSHTYWTMSPLTFDSVNGVAYSWVSLSDGSLGYGSIANSDGVRPVINLKADTEISGGIGTANDPFVVK